MGTEDPWGESEPSADMNYDPTTVIPPPPAELPPPPPSRPKSADPLPMSSPNPPPPGPSVAESTITPPVQTQPKGPSFFSKIKDKINLTELFSTTVSSKTIIATVICLGFLMFIISESYANSANYSNAPDVPLSSDFDLDNNGLNTAESENYTAALQQYAVDLDVYNDKVNSHTGNSIFWGNVSSAFIVGGLVGLTFSSKAVEMSNAVRLTLLIGTIYMLGGMMGYELPGVDAAVGFGFGG